ncbi:MULTISPECIES: segregation/condensation protein A [unclassified Clostridium]|uniref:segregation/condensation protein A n=1 Tax=unclassified Clostridium TaxID=2614128 RepID=UPI0029154123|nr:segregation/condensation protein A [Clostridium sp.]MDU5106672.1 segregation/condensation protein A [Clostridium sp.]
MEMPKIKVANFEGPFDLLLHLIKKNEMDIYNIEIYKITNQYLRYLDDMKIMDLDITSEFIVVAATLIEIKSKKLLPVIKNEEENEEDIEKNLMYRLIEYKKIKGAALFLRDKFVSSGEIYTKKPEIIKEVNIANKEEDIFKNITLLDLYNIYNNLIENYIKKQNKENVIQRKIYVDKYKIEDKMNDLMIKFNNNKIVKFREIIKESECKLEAVVIFLALLELIKLRMLKVYQDNNFDDILMERRIGNE